MLINMVERTLSQCLCVSNNQAVHFNYNMIVNCISIKPKKKMSTLSHKKQYMLINFKSTLGKGKKYTEYLQQQKNYC